MRLTVGKSLVEKHGIFRFEEQEQEFEDKSDKRVVDRDVRVHNVLFRVRPVLVKHLFETEQVEV